MRCLVATRLRRFWVLRCAQDDKPPLHVILAEGQNPEASEASVSTKGGARSAHHWILRFAQDDMRLSFCAQSQKP